MQLVAIHAVKQCSYIGIIFNNKGNKDTTIPNHLLSTKYQIKWAVKLKERFDLVTVVGSV